MKSIGVSGVPGTGKSALAQKLSKELGMRVIELSSFAIENNYIIAYDHERKSYIIDEDKLRDAVYRIAKEEPIIIVSHYIEIVPRDALEIVVVLRRNPIELLNILKGRGWDDRKIAENIEAELLGVCTVNAIEELGEDIVVEVDATSKTVDELSKEVINIIFGEEPIYTGYSIDWLERMDEKSLEYIINYINKHRT